MKLTTGLLTIILPATLAAQATTGDLRGRVTREAGDLPPGLEVLISGDAPPITRRARVAPDGVFEARGLPPGIYGLLLRSPGHIPVRVDSLVVRLGATTEAPSIILRAATTLLETTRIVAPPASLDPVRTTIGGSLRAEEIRALPGDRDYRSLIAILPHVNTSYYGDMPNVAGNTGLDNLYYIDGVNVTMPVNAATGTSLPYNFISAVEVRAGGYEAEYGRALGAIVNAVTHTGGNTFETQAFGYLSHGALALSPRQAPVLAEGDAVNGEFGVRMSGPIVRDRAWFTVAYGPRRERVERTIAGFGTYPATVSSDAFAAKATWQVGPRVHAALSIFGDPTESHTVASGNPSYIPASSDPYRAAWRTGGWALSGRLTAQLLENLEAELQFGRVRSRAEERGETQAGRDQGILFDDVSNQLAGGYGFVYDVSALQRSVDAKVSFDLGRHALKAGVSLEHADVESLNGTTGVGMVFRRTEDPGLYIASSGSIPASIVSKAPAAFAQDVWSVSERLTTTFGLRWGEQVILGSSGEVRQVLSGQWQPRLGFSLRIGDAAGQRVFGSAARFYQQQPLYLAAVAFADQTWLTSFYSTNPLLAGATPDSSQSYTQPESAFGRLSGDKADRTDELSLGYERVLEQAVLTVRGVTRRERSAVVLVGGFGPFGVVVGVPGEGELASLPRAHRRYRALEADLRGTRGMIGYRASYVLSSNRGNYPGLFNQGPGSGMYPGANNPFHSANPDGPLPNDRTHVLKLTLTRRPAPWGAGIFATIQSGTPVNELANNNATGGTIIVGRRGAGGRSPTIADLNLRLSYATRVRTAPAILVLDLLHIGNPRTAVLLNEVRWDGLDPSGNPTGELADFRTPLAFQPPMALRLGFEIGR